TERVCEPYILQSHQVSALNVCFRACVKVLPVGADRIHHGRNGGVPFIAGILPAERVIGMPIPRVEQRIVIDGLFLKVMTELIADAEREIEALPRHIAPPESIVRWQSRTMINQVL